VEQVSRKLAGDLSRVKGLSQVRDAKKLIKYPGSTGKAIPDNVLVYYLDTSLAAGTPEFAVMKSDIDKTAGGFSQAGRHYLLGQNILHNEIIRTSRADFSLFLPLAFAVSVVILLLIYKNPFRAAIPLVCLAMTLAGTLGIFSLLKIPLMITTVIFPAVVLVLCLNDSIYILNGALKSDEELERLIVPCFQTSLVLVIGFSALMFTDLRPVLYLGGMCLTGICFSFFSAVAVVPVLIKGGPESARVPVAAPIGGNWRGFYSGVFKNSRPILVISLIVTLACLAVLPLLRINVEALKYFKKAPEFSSGFEFFRKNNIPVDRFSVFVRFNDREGQLKKLSVISQAVESNEGIMSVFSASKLALLKMRLAGAGMMAPVSRETELEYMPDKEGYYRIDVFNNFGSTAEFGQFQKVFTEKIKSAAGFGFDHKFAGGVYVSWFQERKLVNSQVTGFIRTFILIMILFCAIFGLKIGVIASLENLLPVIVTLAVAASAGITLNFSTIMIANVVIGLAAEDTIYLLHRYKAYAKNNGPESAFKLTAIELGSSSVNSSVIMAIGFLVLVFSSFVPSVQLSLLVSIAIIAALTADMILLPVLLAAAPGNKHK
jgi:predicted RND superfamily exporter protein